MANEVLENLEVLRSSTQELRAMLDELKNAEPEVL